jgi:hypothetical protein
MREASSDKVYPITTDEPVLGRKLDVLEKDGKIMGIKYAMKSSTECPYKAESSPSLKKKPMFNVTFNI